MNEVGFNGKFSRLRLRREVLREECANLIELHMHLVNVVGPNVKSRYMVKIGVFEHRVYGLETEILRWQRRFTLRQMALNRGAKPDFAAIEAQLDAEFAQYAESVKRHLREMAEATATFHALKMSDEEMTAVRAAYLDAAKKLHPDVNPGQPNAARELWHQIQKAYEARDWSNVKFLAGLVESVVRGENGFAVGADGMAGLEASIAKLEAKCSELRGRNAALKVRPPFVYKEFLDDADEVDARRNRLLAQIKALEKSVGEYEEAWNNGK